MNDIFINLISTIITILIARSNIFTPKKLDIYEKQLYNVYLPLFAYIEPYLYKDDTPIDVINMLISKFDNIKNNYYELIDSNLLNDFLLLKKSINNSSYSYIHYESFCSTLDSLFERSRKKLSLPTRKIYYKLNNKQYPKFKRNAMNNFVYFAGQILSILFLGIMIFTMIHLFQTILHSIFNLIDV